MAMKKIAIGCEPSVGSLIASKTKEYKITTTLEEGGFPIYAVVFNFLDVRFFNNFATAGGNKVNVYQCLERKGRNIVSQGSYVDEDKEESYYADPFLVAGGRKGIMRVIDVGKTKIHKSLVGHGGAINEIKTHPLKPSLVITASSDESVRLWNIETGICILIFVDSLGNNHKFVNEVASVDFDPSDKYQFVSCGKDNTVKIWSMEEFWPHVELSYAWKDHPSKFGTKYVKFPKFIAMVHSNYVDCNRWFGDFILSKSVENEILLWEPKISTEIPGEGTTDILFKYPVPDCNVQFIKFSCDFKSKTLAIYREPNRRSLYLGFKCQAFSSDSKVIKLKTEESNQTDCYVI